MTKITCNIIKDLLPSYIDGICSEDTHTLVETHLADCPACAQAAQQMQETAAKPLPADLKEMDFLKKVKNYHYQEEKRILGLFLLFAITAVFLFLIKKGYATLPANICAFTGLIFLSCLYLLAGSTPAPFFNRILPKKRTLYGWTLAAALPLIYEIILMLLAGILLNDSSKPLGLPLSDIGPLWAAQLKIVLLIEIILLLIGIFRLGGRPCAFFLCESVTACFLALAYLSFLGNMVSTNLISALVLQITLHIGIFCLLPYCILKGYLLLAAKHRPQN